MTDEHPDHEIVRVALERINEALDEIAQSGTHPRLLATAFDMAQASFIATTVQPVSWDMAVALHLKNLTGMLQDIGRHMDAEAPVRAE